MKLLSTCFVLCIIESELHVYDGFIFPKDKRLSLVSSKDSHGHALNIFLKAINLSKSCFDVLQTFEYVCNIYFHLKHKQYLLSSDERKCKHFCCVDQLNTGLQQVCVSILYLYISVCT